jgi:uncharacterized protein YijF (DUF1287 family)
VAGVVSPPDLAGIRALLDPKLEVEKPQMPVFAAGEEEAYPAGLTQDGVPLAGDAAYVVLTFPTANIACGHGLCAGLVIRTFRPVHPHNFSKHGHESMVEGIALHPPS